MSLQLYDICVCRGGKDILSHVSLTLPPTGVIALTGPSGAGKTTLLHVLAGLLPPDSGRIEGICGKRISMVFQEDRLLPWYTAYENVRYALPRGANDAIVMDCLRRMALLDAAHQYPAELSGGMRRRLSIARALAYGGDVLLLDEPFNGLDEALRAHVAAQLHGCAPLTVLVSHSAQEAALLNAQIVRLDEINRC